MKKSKTQKGITLVALIITIVVLLILATIAVSSIQNDGIIQYAQEGGKDYNQAVVNEQQMLNTYMNYMNNSGSTSKDTIAPTSPTEIVATAVSGSTITLQATGGTDESGTVAGYQYSMDGTTWSETIASGTGYTTAELTNGTNWIVYVRTVDGAGNFSTTTEYSIISFSISSTTYYAKEGMNWYEWCGSNYNNSLKWVCNSLDGQITDGGDLNTGYDVIDDVIGLDVIISTRYWFSWNGPMDWF